MQGQVQRRHLRLNRLDRRHHIAAIGVDHRLTQPARQALRRQGGRGGQGAQDGVDQAGHRLGPLVTAGEFNGGIHHAMRRSAALQFVGGEAQQVHRGQWGGFAQQGRQALVQGLHLAQHSQGQPLRTRLVGR